MGKIFELTAKLLTERKHSKIWHRLSTLIACLVVFTTTYSMILPALTFDEVTASEEPGFDMGTAETEQAVPAEDVSQNEYFAEEPIQNDSDYTVDTGSTDAGELIVEEEPAAVPAADTTNVYDNTVPTEEAGFAPEGDGEIVDFSDTEEPETVLTYEDAEVRITASFEDPAYEIPAGLTLKVAPIAYGSEQYNALNNGANERLTEIGNYVISYSAYYDIWFELNNETVIPALNVKLEAQYKNRDLGENGVKLFSYNYDGNAITLHDDVTWGVYDDTDPTWPWRSSFTFRTHGGDVNGHTLVGLMNTEVTEEEATETESEDAEAEDIPEEAADSEQDAAEASIDETATEETGSEEAQAEEAVIGAEETIGEEDYEVVEEDVIPAADDEMAEDETADEENAEDEAAEDGAASEDENAAEDETTADDEAETGETSEEAEAEETSLYKTGKIVSEGLDYVVELDVPEAAHIPEDAELKVDEIDPESEEYKAYYDQAMAAIKEEGRDVAEGFGRFFDIRFEKDGVEIEPNPIARISVKITFAQTVDQQTETENAEVGEVQGVHFTENGVEDVKVEAQGEAGSVDQITFKASSFSVYGFVYTVDFETVDGGTYSVPGEGSYRLNDLLPFIIGKEGVVTEAALRIFEGEEVIGALYLEQDESGDWYISSEVAFDDTYLLTITVDGVKYDIKVTDAAETTNLNSLVTNFSVSGATQNPDGSYTVVPGKSYSTDISFNESERTFQFSNHGEMVYTIPEGITLGGVTSPFDISFNYLGRNITISGNTARVEGNKLYIKFNDQDPEYNKFQSITTAQVKVHTDVTFTNQQSEYVIPGGGTYKVDTKPDVNLTKSGRITNFDTGEVKYTLNLTSNGSNGGIDIKDVIEGDALSLVSGSVKMYDSAGNQVSISVTENLDDTKGFKFNTGALQDGNYKIEYTAQLDKNKLTENGNTLGEANDTNNTVTYGPDDKTTSYNLGHIVEGHNAWKGSSGSTTDDSTNKATTTWNIQAYTMPTTDGRLAVVTDQITEPSSGVTYSGEGITVTITDLVTGNKVVQEKLIPWSSLNKTENSWNFDFSQWSDYPNAGKYWRYDISYTTEADMSQADQSLTIKNEFDPNNGDPTEGTGTAQPPTTARTGIQKNVSHIDHADGIVTWRITLTIPARGVDISKSFVEEILPHVNSYQDTYVDDSFEYISGNVSGDGTPTVSGTGSVDDPLKFTWEGGFARTDAQRQIVFEFKSQYDDNWLNDDAANNRHLNEAIFNNDHTWADVTPVTPLFKKTGSTFRVENGEIYFDFSILTSNINAASLADNNNSIVLTDTFDSHLEYVAGTAKLYGGDYEYNTTRTYDDSVPTVSTNGNTAKFTITKDNLPGVWGQKEDGSWGELEELYPFYKLTYTMKVKDPNGIMAEALKSNALTVSMNNTVTSNVGNDDTTVTYTPNVLDKYESARDADGHVEFTIKVNTAQIDLDPDSDVIILTDKLTNISAKYEDIHISFPSGNYPPASGNYTTTDGNGNVVAVPYFNMSGDTITFYLPDGVETLITYNTKPYGEVGADGKIHYTNEADLSGYKKTVTGDFDWNGNASATGTQYGVKLYKADGYVNSTMVPGAKFKLFIADGVDENGNIISGTPMKNADGTDFIVTTGTDPGGIEIKGDANLQGWNLKPEQRYYLMEVEAPEGYAVDNTKYQFIISSQGYVNYSRNAILAPDGSGAIIEPWTYYNGDVLTVKNWPKTGELKITKNFATGSDITKISDLDDDQKSAVKFEIYSGKTEEDTTTWTLLKTIGLDQFMASSTGDTGTYTIGDLPAGKYKVIEIVNDQACKEQTYQVVNNGDAVIAGTATEASYATIEITEDDIKDKNAHEVTITNKYEQESEFKIYKYANQLGADAVGESPKDVRLAGAEFKVYAVDGTNKPTGTEIETFTTNARGRFDISFDDTKYDYDIVYALKETKAPDGYKLSTDVVYFCFLGNGSTVAPSGAPGGIVTIPYKGTNNLDIPNDVGTTSIGAEKIWLNDKLEPDTKTNDVFVKIKQTQTYDKAGKLVVPGSDKYYPNDATIYTLKKEGNDWKLSLDEVVEGVTIENGRLVNLPTLAFDNMGVPLYYQYEVEEVVPGGYNATYETATDTNGKTVTITNTPNTVTSKTRVSARKVWVDASGNDITSQMGVGDAVTVKVYRKEGVVREGTLKKNGSEDISAGQLIPILFKRANGGQIEPTFSQSAMAVLPGDILQVTFSYIGATETPSESNISFGEMNDGNNIHNASTIVKNGDKFVTTYTVAATDQILGAKTSFLHANGFIVDIVNLTAQGRTQVLTQDEANSVGGSPVQTLELGKQNNWQATSKELPGGSGNTVYTYYIVEDSGANYSAQYVMDGDSIIVRNTDKRLRVDKKWFRPDAVTEFEKTDESIEYDIYQVISQTAYKEGQYTGDGPYRVDISELLTGDIQNHNNYPGSITLTGHDKIRAGSNVKITIEADHGDDNSIEGTNPNYPFEVTGGESVDYGHVENDSDYTNTKIKRRVITVTNVTSNMKLKGYLDLKKPETSVTITVEVLGEYDTIGEPIEEKVGTVTMNYDSVSIDFTEKFADDDITAIAGRENWSSIISNLPATGSSETGAPENYTYRIEEVQDSIPENFELLSVDPSTPVSNAGSVVIKNKAKPAKVRVTKVFLGIETSQIPADFQITNNVTNDVFTISNIKGGAGTEESPYYWKIDNLMIGDTVRFYESGIMIDDNELTVTINGQAAELTDLSGRTTAIETLPGDINGTEGTVHFVNNYESKGSLKLTKAVTVNGDSTNTKLADGEYTFTITGPDSSTDTVATVVIKVEDGKAKQYKVDDAENFSDLPADKFVIIPDLAVGEYTIKETEPTNGTAISKINDTDSTSYSTKVTVAPGDTTAANASAKFTNNINTGDLSIEKITSGTTAADADDVFTFTVALTAPQNVTLANSYTARKSTDSADTIVTVANNQITDITLKANETFTIKGLPAGTGYTVTEAAATGYTTNIPDNSGTIADTANSTVTVTATNTRDKGSLRIEKKVALNGTETTDFKLNGTYTFIVAGKANTKTDGISKTVYVVIENGVIESVSGDGIKSENYAVVDNLPTGEYTVSENTPAAGITLLSSSNTDITVAKDPQASVPTATFTNNKPETSTHVVGTKVFTNGQDKTQFSFTISSEDSTAPMPASPTVNATADGAITFGTMTYPLSLMSDGQGGYLTSKTFTYKVVENPPSGSTFTAVDRAAGQKIINGIVYDTTTKTVTVTVTYDETTGKMTATPNPATLNSSFTNVQLGSLKVTKTVKLNNGDYKNHEALTFYVGLFEDSTATKADTANVKPITVANGSATGTVTYDNLTIGQKYYVYETDADGKKLNVNDKTQGYFVTANGGQSDPITVTPTVNIDVVNEKRTGDLELTKKVAGEGADTNKSFAFSIALTAPEGETLAENYSFKKGNGAATDITYNRSDENTKATIEGISLKANEVFTIENLPAGTAYVITETNYSSDGYSSAANALKDPMIGTITGGTKTKEAIEVINTFSAGSLIVKKIVAGDGGNTDKDFAFSVTLSKESLSGTYGSYKIGTEANVDNASAEAISFNNGTCTETFNLRHGQVAKFINLPVGTAFTVRETVADQDGYETIVTKDGVVEDDKVVDGNITTTGATEAAFKNTKDTTTIEAIKAWKSGSGATERTIEWPEDVESVEFSLYAKVGNATEAVAITDNSVRDCFTSIEATKVVKSDTVEKKASWSNLPTRVITKAATGTSPAVWSDVIYSVVETKVTYTAESEKVALETTEAISTAFNPTAWDETNKTITNNIPKVDVDVTKSWAEPENIPANTEVTVTLSAKVGEADYDLPSGTKTVIKLNGDTTKDDDKETAWYYKWTDLPKYNDAGSLITYKAEETALQVNGEVVNVADFKVEADREDTDYNFYLKNQIPPTSLKVKKAWTTTPPPNSSVELTLSATVPGEGTSTTPVAITTLNVTPDKVTLDGSTETTSWEYEWSELPQYYGGKKVTYTVTETKVTIGGITVWDSRAEDTETNLYLTGTNDSEATETAPRTITFTNDFTEYSVEKIWNAQDTSDYDNYVVRVQLKQGEDNYGTTVDLVKGADSKWSYKWTGLPKEDANHTAYEYSVEEVAVFKNTTDAAANEGAGQNAITSKFTVSYDTSTAGKTTIKNSELTEVEGTKVWEIVSDTLPADDPVLTLTRTSKKPESETETVKKADKPEENLQPTWKPGADAKSKKFTYTDLPKYDDYGYLYDYTVTEASFKIGEVTYTVTKDGENYIATPSDDSANPFVVAQAVSEGKTTITNTEKKEFEFTKEWRGEESNAVVWEKGTSITVNVKRKISGNDKATQDFKTYTITKEEDGFNISPASGLTIVKNSDDEKVYTFKLSDLDAKGEITVSGQEPVKGEFIYYATEVKPEGYREPSYSNPSGSSGSVPSEDYVLHKGTIINTPFNAIELPSTGGRGTLPFKVSGSILLAFSALMYVTSFRRRQQEALARSGGYFEGDAEREAMRGGGSRR